MKEIKIISEAIEFKFVFSVKTHPEGENLYLVTAKRVAIGKDPYSEYEQRPPAKIDVQKWMGDQWQIIDQGCSWLEPQFTPNHAQIHLQNILSKTRY